MTASASTPQPDNPFSAPDGVDVTLRGRLRADNRDDGARFGQRHPMHYADDFLIGRCDSQDYPDPSGFVVKGYIPAAGFGEEYEWTGAWQTDPRWGRQFAFTSARLLLPETSAGIVRYLSRTTKHIGEATARAIVDLYGNESLNVLRDCPARVADEVRGISPERAREISEKLIREGELAEARVALEQMLAGYKLPGSVIAQALDVYGTNAALVVRDNPYLLTRFNGVGFKRADQVALLRVGYPKDGQHRRRAAALYAMQQALNREGHTVMDPDWLNRETIKLIRQTPGDAVDVLLDEDWIRNTNIGGPGLQLSCDARDEQTIAERTRCLLSHDPLVEFAPLTDGLSGDQVTACKQACRHNLLVVTGRPGTGKTYVLERIVQAWMLAAATDAGAVTILADCPDDLVTGGAPTGKAAKRLSESIGIQARTIHSLLGLMLDNETGEFTARNENAGSEIGGLLILDEWSMADTALAARLMAAIPDTTQVIIVGDPDQLPSVGRGAVLRDMVTAGVPCVTLKEIQRNSGALVRGIHAIGDGLTPIWSERLDLPAGENLRFMEVPGDDVPAMLPRVLNSLERLGFDPAWDVQVLSPVNDMDPLGVRQLNETLGPFLLTAPSDAEAPFRIGEKVLQCKNGSARLCARRPNGDWFVVPGENAEVRVVNGDLGRIEGYGFEMVRGKRVPFMACRHWFPDRTVVYPFRRNGLRAAWGMTVHKMQGSSAPVVVIPVHRSFAGGPLWYREWIYTAVSRAEQACILVGEEALFRRALNRSVRDVRQTRLRQLLEEALI